MVGTILRISLNTMSLILLFSLHIYCQNLNHELRQLHILQQHISSFSFHFIFPSSNDSLVLLRLHHSSSALCLHSFSSPLSFSSPRSSSPSMMRLLLLLLLTLISRSGASERSGFNTSHHTSRRFMHFPSI